MSLELKPTPTWESAAPAPKQNGPILRYEVRLSPECWHKLRWLVTANRQSAGALDASIGIDKAADTIIRAYMSQNYPGLAEYWSGREKLDLEAVEAIKGQYREKA